MPEKRELVIAHHACKKYTGRVGRSAAAKAFDEGAVFLAVRAHIRHQETSYDDILISGGDRHIARAKVKEMVEEVVERWQNVR